MATETAPPSSRTAPFIRSLWDDTEAGQWTGSAADPVLGLRIYTSRLLGRDRSLVLHGGGNTSAKSRVRDLLGRELEVLYVKGSGGDLATIDAAGYTPLDLQAVRPLLHLPRLADEDMVRELRRFRLDPDAATPSVETLLHAYLPFRFVDHTHADALLALIQTPDGPQRAAELYGDDYLIVPYVKPGFDLARLVKEMWDDATAAGRAGRAGRRPLAGLILLNHGAFTFDDDARVSYERMIDCVARAERAIAERRPSPPGPLSHPLPPTGRGGIEGWGLADIGRLRAGVSRLAGRPMTLRLDDGEGARRFASHPGLPGLARRGTLTPDHVIRTKRIAAVVDDPREIDQVLERYADDYRAYFAEHVAGRPLEMLDPAPRVIVARGLGVFTAGATPADAQVVLDIYQHSMEAVLTAEELGGFRPLPPADLFEVEYWDLEQAKLRRRPKPAPLAGRVAVVTGAASGIGNACAAALRAQGAAVAGLDLNPLSETGADLLSLVCDVTDPAALRHALEETIHRFGGVDILVLNAGIFHAGPTLEELDDDAFRRVLELNTVSHLSLLREAVPLLKLGPEGGSVVIIGSKNVAAPGPGAGAYSASKAALTQLGRVAALELAPHGIRVNTLHPDGVFDTGVWTPELLAQRAARYGLTVEQYKRRNLLGTEIRSTDVGALAAALCTGLFAKTTGAQIPVDGGNDRVI